jgi:hypothetical protein
MPEVPKDNKHEEQQSHPNFTMNRFLLKIKYSFYSTLVFFVFANPETFRIMQGLIGSRVDIITSGGAPTPVGFFLHAGLFFLTMLGLMMLPAD